MFIDVYAIYDWLQELVLVLTSLWDMLEYSLVDGLPVLADKYAVIFGSSHPSVFICNILDDVLVVIEVVFPIMIPFYNFPLGSVLTVVSTIGIFVLFIYKLVI